MYRYRPTGLSYSSEPQTHTEPFSRFFTCQLTLRQLLFIRVRHLRGHSNGRKPYAIEQNFSPWPYLHPHADIRFRANGRLVGRYRTRVFLAKTRGKNAERKEVIIGLQTPRQWKAS